MLASALPFLALALSATLLAVSGCTNAPRRGADGDRPAPQPVITGSNTFLDDRIQVIAQLGPFRLIDALPAERIGGTPVAIDEELLTASRPRTYAGPGGAGGPAGRGSNIGGPPGRGVARQSLTVTLSNRGTEPIRLRVAEVRSVLGNFVPVPEVFTLEPGQVQALESMRSFYPAAIDELELVVRLRTADADDLQTLKLTL